MLFWSLITSFDTADENNYFDDNEFSQKFLEYANKEGLRLHEDAVDHVVQNRQGVFQNFLM